MLWVSGFGVGVNVRVDNHSSSGRCGGGVRLLDAGKVLRVAGTAGGKK